MGGVSGARFRFRTSYKRAHPYTLVVALVGFKPIDTNVAIGRGQFVT